MCSESAIYLLYLPFAQLVSIFAHFWPQGASSKNRPSIAPQVSFEPASIGDDMMGKEIAARIGLAFELAISWSYNI